LKTSKSSLAVDGKLLKAHKVVLAICSPYFQEMFLTMSQNQHPVLILKDTSVKLVSNLLEYMYQGTVNVNQEDLQAFMKIAETLKIKGLTTNSKETRNLLNEASKPKPGELEFGLTIRLSIVTFGVFRGQQKIYRRQRQLTGTKVQSSKG
jgi:BTB/POZ domain